MIQTIILFIAVFLIINAIYNTIIICKQLSYDIVKKSDFISNIIFITIGLTYIIWYCN